MAAAALEKRSGLLKNAPLVAGSGWGRNDTPTHSDPVSHGMVIWAGLVLNGRALR